MARRKRVREYEGTTYTAKELHPAHHCRGLENHLIHLQLRAHSSDNFEFWEPIPIAKTFILVNFLNIGDSTPSFCTQTRAQNVAVRALWQRRLLELRIETGERGEPGGADWEGRKPTRWSDFGAKHGLGRAGIRDIDEEGG